MLPSGEPSSRSAGTAQSSKRSRETRTARSPSIGEPSSIVSPGVPRSTANGWMPNRPRLGSVVANTTTYDARPALPMKHFSPASR